LRDLLDERNHTNLSTGKFQECQAIYFIHKITLRDCVTNCGKRGSCGAYWYKFMWEGRVDRGERGHANRHAKAQDDERRKESFPVTAFHVLRGEKQGSLTRK
jgi:hypothetical protein